MHLTNDGAKCTNLGMNKLAALRSRLNLSRSEMAEMIGMDKTSVSRMERGLQNITPTLDILLDKISADHPVEQVYDQDSLPPGRDGSLRHGPATDGASAPSFSSREEAA